MTTGKGASASRTPHKSPALLAAMTSRPDTAETNWWPGSARIPAQRRTNQQASKMDGIFCLDRQKSNDHQQGRQRQLDAAQITGLARCHDLTAGHGRNELVARIGKDPCPVSHKSAREQDGRDFLPGPAEIE
jgi:hypothetical protein